MANPDAAALVRRAFERARDAGKVPWAKMTVPVLKNRLLQLTEGAFREDAFGASSFREFLSRLPEGFITIDNSTSPATVILTSADVPARPSSASRSTRIRSDLWRAALDYSSGNRYLWDRESEQARAAVAAEPGPFLPTITEEELRQVRGAFASAHSGSLDEVLHSRVERWAAEGLPTALLPAHLRPLWNTELKRQVQTRLRAWFEEQGVQPPADLITEGALSRGAGGQEEDLRRFVLACVQAMTREQLEELRIPAIVAQRARIGVGRE